VRQHFPRQSRRRFPQQSLVFVLLGQSENFRAQLFTRSFANDCFGIDVLLRRGVDLVKLPTPCLAQRLPRRCA